MKNAWKIKGFQRDETNRKCMQKNSGDQDRGKLEISLWLTPHVGSNPTRSATSSFLENSRGDCIPTSCFQWTAPNNTNTAKRPGDGVLITREGPVRIRNAAVLVLLSSVLKIGIRDNSRVKRMVFQRGLKQNVSFLQ